MESSIGSGTNAETQGMQESRPEASTVNAVMIPWFMRVPWIPKFSGKGGAAAFEEWRVQMEVFLRVQGLSSQQRVDFVLSALEGEARQEVQLAVATRPCLQGVVKLDPQLPVVLPPEKEVMLWTQISQGKGLADCLVIVEDLDNGDHEWWVARTLVYNPNPFPVQLPQGHPLAAVVQVAANDVQRQSELVLTSTELAVV
ncbi:hypothetical protein SRHO_G00215990 [Serrasalmus rhombeus]